MTVIEYARSHYLKGEHLRGSEVLALKVMRSVVILQTWRREKAKAIVDD